MVQGFSRLLNTNPSGFAGPGAPPSRAGQAAVADLAAEDPAAREARIAADPLFQAGAELRAGGREAYTPNPRFAGEFWSDTLPSSAGSTLPTLAAGAVAGPAVAGQFGRIDADQADGAWDVGAADRVAIDGARALADDGGRLVDRHGAIIEEGARPVQPPRVSPSDR